MMVMITAITPSVNASSRALFIAAVLRGERSSEFHQLLAEILALEQRDEARGGVVDSLDDRFAVLELALGEAAGEPGERFGVAILPVEHDHALHLATVHQY